MSVLNLYADGKTVKPLFLIFALLIFAAWPAFLGRPLNFYEKMRPGDLEMWIEQTLPHVPDFFDCTERAWFARKALTRQGCTARYRIYLPRGGRFKTHTSVIYDCTAIGYGKGEILDI